jgi:hypothetical protein
LANRVLTVEANETSPHHTRLSVLLADAATQRGSQAALASDLGLGASELNALINGKRHVTIRQAIAIEDLLGVPARGILLEAAIARIDQALGRLAPP